MKKVTEENRYTLKLPCPQLIANILVISFKYAENKRCTCIILYILVMKLKWVSYFGLWLYPGVGKQYEKKKSLAQKAKLSGEVMNDWVNSRGAYC